MRTPNVLVLLTSSVMLASCSSSETSTTQPIVSSCFDVAILTVRAAGEAPGEGVTSAVVDKIIAGTPRRVERASINYPADPDNYASSVASGVISMKERLSAQISLCPNEKIVLLGYSQGAGVVLDALGGGGGGTLGATVSPVSASVASHITAAVVFGDSRHVVGQSYNAGTATRSGLYPRTGEQISALSALAARLRAYCDAGDPYCDSGSDLRVHLQYINRYQAEASQFVVTLIGA